MSGKSRQPKPVRDATTVLLLRPAQAEPFEIFMVRRTAKAAFMASAMVFPGGRVDAADADDRLAARCDLSRADAAARMGMDDGRAALALMLAGVRETFEEAGLLLARGARGPLDFADAGLRARLEKHRDALNAYETTLVEVAEAEDLRPEVERLAFYARWITPPIESRRFDARFLIARAPAGQRGAHDAVETTASAWLGPKAALAGYDCGALQLAPPTLRVLLELARAESLEAALAIEGIPAPVQPQPRMQGGGLALVLPGDPEFDPPGSTPNRITMRDGRWHSTGRGV